MGIDIVPGLATAHPVARIVLVEQRSLNRQLLQDWLTTTWPDCRTDAVGHVDELKSDDLPVRLAVLSLGTTPVDTATVRSAIRLLHRLVDPQPLLLLGERHDSDDVAEALAMGARGYVPTSLDSAAAARAIEFVLAGGRFVPAEALPASTRCAGANGKPALTILDQDPLLTPREREVAMLVCAGKPNKIIAHELQISEATVKVFVRHILSKLGASNRTEAASTIRRRFGNVDEAISQLN